jgi:hypothetical protein
LARKLRRGFFDIPIRHAHRPSARAIMRAAIVVSTVITIPRKRSGKTSLITNAKFILYTSKSFAFF